MKGRSKYTLTDEALDRIAEFQSTFTFKHGCLCHRFPPCGYCTHEDNPANIAEEDESWRLKTPAELRADRRKRSILPAARNLVLE